MKARAKRLLERGAELRGAEYHYAPVVQLLGRLHRELGRSEFGRKLDRGFLAELERVLVEEIRPQIQTVREEYVRLCGFEWGDWVRIQNPGVAAVELVATDLHFRPGPPDPYAWLHGKALKANGRPGRKGAQVRLVAGSSKVTVLSTAAGRA